jgi:hypothetical protein
LISEILRRVVSAGAAALLGCSIALASPAGHEAHGKPAVVRPGLGASALFDASGVLWAVSREGDHVMLRRSPDRGATWSTPVAVNAQAEAVVADGDSRPHLAIGSAGEIYVTWTQSLGAGHIGYIRFARSTDAGRSFGEPLTVHGDRRLIAHAFDSIAVSSEGKVFVAWIDKRDGGGELYYAVSDDRGASFRGETRAAAHSCDCCRIALLPQEGGSVLALWRGVFAPNIRDHALVTLGADGVASAARRATFDDWRVDACPHQGPSMARDAHGHLHAVWFSGTPGKEGVYYGRLTDGRVEGQRRIGGDTAAHADLAIRGDRIAVAWKEFDGTQSVLRTMRSDDGGATWRESRVAASAGATDQPKVLANGGDFYVFWNSRDKPLLTVALP